MRSLIVTALFSFLLVSAKAQTTVDSTALFVDKLFELAWENYPENKVKIHQEYKAYYNMKHAQYSWTDDIIGQFNLNEANINPSSTGGQNIYYPKYLAGVRLSLGTFVLKPIDAKRAREEYNAAMSEVDLQKVLIKEEVAKRLERYRVSKSMLKIKTQAVEESSMLQKVVKQKFQNSEIEIEDYNKASITNLQLLESKLAAESEFNMRKIELETIVGVKLELLKFPANF